MKRNNQGDVRWAPVQQLHLRSLGLERSGNFRDKANSAKGFVQRLVLSEKLKYHDGCVNTLHFNPTGDLIASGSDDLNVAIWDWAAHPEIPKIKYDSGHTSNVFQAKFMPHSNDATIISCARDGQVRVGFLSLTNKVQLTKRVAQHRGAAHKLCIEPGSPHVLMTCGEDAVVYNIDLREQKPNKLFSLQSEKKKRVALYSVNINPTNVFEFAVGGRDQYARIFDRRKVCQETTHGLLKKFCPDHLKEVSEYHANITCLVYNYNGTELKAEKAVAVPYQLATDDHLNDTVTCLGESIFASVTEPKRGHGHIIKQEDVMRLANQTLPEELERFLCLFSSNIADIFHDDAVKDVELLTSYNDEDIYLFDSTESESDFKHRYKGHRNCATVKGVNFFGPRSEYVVSGSDCSHIFLWQKDTEEIVQFLSGDETGVVNVLEPHPHCAFLATSGLDHDIKIWTPTGEQKTLLHGLEKQIKENNKEREDEKQRTPDPFGEHLLFLMFREFSRRQRRQNLRGRTAAQDENSSDSSECEEERDEGAVEQDEDTDDEEFPPDGAGVQCHQS